jgi:hypothetical protein
MGSRQYWRAVLVGSAVLLLVGALTWATFFSSIGDRSLFGVVLDHIPGIGQGVGTKIDSETGWLVAPFVEAGKRTVKAHEQREAAARLAKDACSIWADGKAISLSWRFTNDALICTGKSGGQVATLAIQSAKNRCALTITTTLNGSVVRRRASTFEAIGLQCP